MAAANWSMMSAPSCAPHCTHRSRRLDRDLDRYVGDLQHLTGHGGCGDSEGMPRVDDPVLVDGCHRHLGKAAPVLKGFEPLDDVEVDRRVLAVCGDEPLGKCVGHRA